MLGLEPLQQPSVHVVRHYTFWGFPSTTEPSVDGEVPLPLAEDGVDHSRHELMEIEGGGSPPAKFGFQRLAKQLLRLRARSRAESNTRGGVCVLVESR